MSAGWISHRILYQSTRSRSFSLRRQSLSCTKLLSPHSSGEGEEEKHETRLAMVNREIVRRGALILFCDYVVRK